jgi:hypothetical protein
VISGPTDQGGKGGLGTGGGGGATNRNITFAGGDGGSGIVVLKWT